MFWIAAFFSNIGMWSLVYGRLWLMRTLTESEIFLGLVLTANLTPILFFSLFGGILSDKHNRLIILRVTRLFFAIFTLITGILIHVDLIEPIYVIVLSIVTGTLLAIDIPARSAMIARIIPKEHLPNGIILYSIIFGGSAIIGPLIFAPIVSVLSIEYLFYFIGLCYFFTVLILLKMNLRLHISKLEKKISYSRSLIEGFAYIKTQKNILYIIILGVIVGLFSSSFEILLPVFTDEVFLGDSRVYSTVLLLLGSGGLIGTVILSISGNHFNKLSILIFSSLCLGLLFVIFSRISNLNIALMIVPFIGLVSVWKGTINTTVIQTLVEENFRGRTMSLQQWSWGSAALGGLFTGFFAESFSSPFTLLISGILIIFFTISIGTLLLSKIR